MRTATVVLTILLLCVGAQAQSPLPVNIDLGIGGGLSMPMGDLGDATDAGYHAGAKMKVHGLMPLNLSGSINYHNLPFKAIDYSITTWSVAAGVEYTLPSAGVKPYFGGDIMMNISSTDIPGTESSSRFGLGLGGGAEITIPGAGSIDASLKYQLLNLIGKEDGENSNSQIAINVVYMFSIM